MAVIHYQKFSKLIIVGVVAACTLELTRVVKLYRTLQRGWILQLTVSNGKRVVKNKGYRVIIGKINAQVRLSGRHSFHAAGKGN